MTFPLFVSSYILIFVSSVYNLESRSSMFVLNPTYLRLFSVSYLVSVSMFVANIVFIMIRKLSFLYYNVHFRMENLVGVVFTELCILAISR